PKFQQQHERRAKRERRKHVVLDGIKRRLRQERDERRHGDSDKIIFWKNLPWGEPAEPHERDDDGNVQKPQPVEQPSAVETENFSRAPPRAREAVIQRWLRGFVIFYLFFPDGFL